MNPNIAMSLDRAHELLVELKAEYKKSLEQRVVSPRAVHFTHEIAERLRSVLDRLARAYWEKHIAPALSSEDQGKASVYFPITNDQSGFDSVMGRWRWREIAAAHSELREYLMSIQPFSKPENRWLKIINDLAIQSKHIDLVPQKRVEERRITVAGPGGASVSWNPSAVRFGPGVSIMGVPVNPQTQRIVPSPNLTERIEIWVSFLIEGHNVEGSSFCTEACEKVRGIASEMTQKFGV